MDGLEVLRRVAEAQDGVVTLAQVQEAGLTARDVDVLCRAGRWRRLARGAYLVGSETVASRRARIRAAVASTGSEAVAALGTAAELHGIAGLRQSGAIHVSVPGPAAKPRRATDPALVIHQLTVAPTDVCAVGGIPVTTPVRTTADLILRVDRYAAVSVLDSALNRELISPEEFAAIPARIRGHRITS